MTSKQAREAVASGVVSARDAVDALMREGDHGGAPNGSVVSCSECGAKFTRVLVNSDDSLGPWNTCSDQCQGAWNSAIFELDGGKRMIKISELTRERTEALLGAVGLYPIGLGVGSGKVVPS